MTCTIMNYLIRENLGPEMTYDDDYIYINVGQYLIRIDDSGTDITRNDGSNWKPFSADDLATMIQFECFK